MKSKPSFSPSNLDTSVRPQDDFFHFAVGGWLKKNPIPKSESQWGAFDALRDQVTKEIHAILKETVTKTRAKKGSDTQLIRDFYLSGMDMHTRNQRGITPLLPVFKKIDAIKSTEDLLQFIAEEHKKGAHYLWGNFVGQDDKDAESYIFHLTQGGLTLPDRDYYLKKDAQSVRIKDAFVSYIERMLTLAGTPKDEANKSAWKILALETRIARASMSRTDTRDIEKIYNKKTRAALKRLASDINWDQYFKTLGVDKKVTSLIVYQPAFFEKLNALLKTISLSTWKTYLYFSALDDAAPLLSKKYIDCAFDFHGKTLSGSESIRPLWKRVTSTLNAYIGEVVGKKYIKKHFPPEAKKKVGLMVTDILAAYKERISAVTWMSQTTKKKALTKLSQIRCKLGYPDVWRSYTSLTIKPDTFYENVSRAVAFEQKKNYQKLGKRVDKKEWFMPPQTVNAYYDPNNNEIVFPAGILQPPFFDAEGDDAINYGAIGSVIGHELTHGFDDSGAKFDGKGNYKNWWRKEDLKQFNKRAQVLVRQFNAYKVNDLPVNGKLTLGENIADLGGLAIAYDAYQRHLEKGGAREKIHGFSPEQRLFIGLATFEVRQARPELARMLLMVDPHSPAKFRMNGPASNLTSFYEAFDVKESDALYRHPKDRAEIW
ncbi:MAG: M13 family metallopeptidase [Patescibacteria group bacterium UBA2163]